VKSDRPQAKYHAGAGKEVSMRFTAAVFGFLARMAIILITSSFVAKPLNAQVVYHKYRHSTAIASHLTRGISGSRFVSPSKLFCESKIGSNAEGNCHILIEIKAWPNENNPCPSIRGAILGYFRERRFDDKFKGLQNINFVQIVRAGSGDGSLLCVINANE